MTGLASVSRDPEPRRWDYTVLLSWRAIGSIVLVVVATLIAVMVVQRAGPVFALLGAAFAAAVIAGPLVVWLSRGIHRAAAMVVVTLAGVVAVVAVLGVVAWDMNRQASALSDALHEAVSELPEGSNAAELAADLELDERIDGLLDRGASRLVIGDTDPLAVAGEVGKIIVVAVMAAFMIAGGRRLADDAVRFVRRASVREQLHDALSSSTTRAGTYLRRMLVVSLVHGLVAAGVVWTLGLPGPIVLGAWVAVMSTMPILGAAIGWLPIVAVATAADTSTALLLCCAVLCIVADRVARARWAHAALRVGPLLAALGIGVGVYVIGIAGAVLGLLVVALVAAFASHDRHALAAMEDMVEDPADRAIPAAVDTEVVREPVTAHRSGDLHVLRARISGRTLITMAVVVVAFTAVLEIASSVQALIVWCAVGGFVAVGLDRPISALQRKPNLPRLLGMAVVMGGMVAVIATVVVVAGPSITRSASSIAADAPETVRSMETLPLIGRVLEKNDASQKVEDFIGTLPDRLHESDAVDRVSRAAGDGLVGVFWIVTIVLAILWDGPRLVDAVRRRIPVANRRRATGFGQAAYTAFSNVVAAAAFVAALNGTVVMLIALGLGIPLAPVLGLWAAAWNFIPQIGGFVGALPLVALGFSQGPWKGLIAVVVFVCYQTFENHVLQPVIGSRVVHVPPLIVLVGALFGGALFGFVGALMAGPVLGVAKVGLNELRKGGRDRIEDRIDEQGVAPFTAERDEFRQQRASVLT